MSANDDEKKLPESLAPRAAGAPPSPTRPPPPSERRNTSMPPPPPRRSVKPSGPPPPPPRAPRGQRLAGVFSTPPPPVEAAPATPEPYVAPPPAPASAPAQESPVVESPVVESPVVESPIVESPIVESPVVEPPIVDSSPAALSTASAQPAVAVPAAALAPAAGLPPYSGAPALGAVSLPVAFVPPSPPPPPFASPKAGASLAERLAVAQTRVLTAIPPQWLALLRKQPALWMVVTPVVLATLLILLAVALAPDIEKVTPEPLARAGTAEAPPSSPATAATDPAPATPAPDRATLAALEAKTPDALTVEEVLLIKLHRAEQKRADATRLGAKLLEQPELMQDAAVQRELLRLAVDPDTAELSLTALARTPSPVATDLLYEVSTNRTLPPATAELASSLLASRDVRAKASPALAVALELRAASSCEAVLAALPLAQSEGDRRSLPALGKLSSRRGCGADKSEDCYPCLRPQMKDVTAATNAVKRRKAPSYGL